MRLGRLIGLVMMLGLVTGCDVVRGGLFVATVSHYHGKENPSREAPSQEVPARQDVPLPPRVAQ